MLRKRMVGSVSLWDKKEFLSYKYLFMHVHNKDGGF